MRHAEVRRSVRLIRVAAIAERVDHPGHRAEVLVVGRARTGFDLLETERPGVLDERVDPLLGVLAQRYAGLFGRGDRAVIHIGEIAHLPHLVALEMAQRTPEHVQADEGPEIADVPAGVDRQPARVHPHGPSVGGNELFFGARESVEKTHRAPAALPLFG